MYFNDGTRESCESIVKAPCVMGECASINDDRINSPASCVNCIDELAFMVGLKIFKSMASCCRHLPHARDVLIESCRPVDLGFALTQKIEIRTVK